MPGRSTEREQRAQDILVGRSLSLSQVIFAVLLCIEVHVCAGVGRLVQNEMTDDAAPHLAELVRANTGLSHLW